LFRRFVANIIGTVDVYFADLSVLGQNRLNFADAKLRRFFQHEIEMRFFNRRTAKPQIRLNRLRARLFLNYNVGLVFADNGYAAGKFAVASVKQAQDVSVLEAENMEQIMGLVGGGGNCAPDGQFIRYEKPLCMAKFHDFKPLFLVISVYSDSPKEGSGEISTSRPEKD